MEIIISWVIPALGIPLMWLLAKAISVQRLLSKILVSCLASLILTFFLVATSIFANTYCIQTLAFCQDHGDVNMSYWYNSILMIPLYITASLVGMRNA